MNPLADRRGFRGMLFSGIIAYCGTDGAGRRLRFLMAGTLRRSGSLIEKPSPRGRAERRVLQRKLPPFRTRVFSGRSDSRRIHEEDLFARAGNRCVVPAEKIRVSLGLVSGHHYHPGPFTPLRLVARHRVTVFHEKAVQVRIRQFRPLEIVASEIRIAVLKVMPERAGKLKPQFRRSLGEEVFQKIVGDFRRFRCFWCF